MSESPVLDRQIRLDADDSAEDAVEMDAFLAVVFPALVHELVDVLGATFRFLQPMSFVQFVDDVVELT